MSEKNIKQFMLTSGDQILTEVITWPDEDGSDIVTRNIMQIHYIVDSMAAPRAVVKPWMTQQCHPDNITTLQIDHIVGSAIPTDSVILSYMTACEFYSEEGSEIESDTVEEDASYEDVLEYYDMKLTGTKPH